MGNYNDFDLDIKKVQGENDIGPASITTTIILSIIILSKNMTIYIKNLINKMLPLQKKQWSK